MAPIAAIQPEIRASVEANAFFLALKDGDYASAAKSQERLKELGWYLSREAPRPKPTRRKKSATTSTQ